MMVKKLGVVIVIGMIVALECKVDELNKECIEKDRIIDELTEELARAEKSKENWLRTYVHEKSKNLFGSKDQP